MCITDSSAKVKFVIEYFLSFSARTFDNKLAAIFGGGGLVLKTFNFRYRKSKTFFPKVGKTEGNRTKQAKIAGDSSYRVSIRTDN